MRLNSLKMPTNWKHQWRPLTDQDTECQTVGCRHSTPDFCRNNATPGKCAFVRDDNICLMPPQTWKKIFARLMAEKSFKELKGP
jgi:hypothetical protein